jgi:hypothetical protein
MNIHGSVSFSDALPHTLTPAMGRAPAINDPPIPGFRHFIEPPGPARQFSIDGLAFEPSDKKQFDTAQLLMKKLAGIIQLEPMPKSFNPRIPSGYTYFLQLLAHDLVNSSLILSRNQGKSLGLGNTRRMPLRLETIYGGGPNQCPFAYESHEDKARARLRLGKTRKDGKPYDNTGDDHRDIARARATEILNEIKYPEALIADARNDSHVIISQLVVFFHHLHNKVFEGLEESTKPISDTFARTQLQFVAAQAACTLIYRSIIRDDLLPLLLHEEVLKAYRTGEVKVIDEPRGLDANDWITPLEFSFGFFRFGHSMIRPKYSFNRLTSIADLRGLDLTSILERSSEKSPELMPLENIWTIDWSRFFDHTSAGTNFSVRIGPWSRMDLENAVRGSDRHAEGLTYRDLISSISAKPWSVRALAQELGKTHARLIGLSPYLTNDAGPGHPPPWFGKVEAWLRQRNRPGLAHPLTDEDIRILATDPPIPFFARFEAGMDPAIGGVHLGVLASIVVADVFYGILEYDRILGVDGKCTLPCQLRRLSETLFDGKADAFFGLEGLVTFNAVIAFLGDQISFPTGG